MGDVLNLFLQQRPSVGAIKLLNRTIAYLKPAPKLGKMSWHPQTSHPKHA